MTEWLKVAVLKTARAQALGGSNPSPSAKLNRPGFDGGSIPWEDRDHVVEEHRGRWGVEPICALLQVAPSTYYAART